MALQKKCTIVSIKDGGPDFGGKLLHGTVRLDCWNVGDDIKVDTPVFTATKTANYKIGDDKTVNEQIAAWVAKLEQQLEPLVKAYVNEETLKTSNKVATAMTTLAESIGG